MELTALVRYGKFVRQVSLPCDSEEVAYRFGYEEGGSFVDKGYFVSR